MKKKIFNFFIFISLENISISRCSLIFRKDKYAIYFIESLIIMEIWMVEEVLVDPYLSRNKVKKKKKKIFIFFIFIPFKNISISRCFLIFHEIGNLLHGNMNDRRGSGMNPYFSRKYGKNRKNGSTRTPSTIHISIIMRLSMKYLAFWKIEKHDIKYF